MGGGIAASRAKILGLLALHAHASKDPELMRAHAMHTQPIAVLVFLRRVALLRRVAPLCCGPTASRKELVMCHTLGGGRHCGE